MKKLIIIISCFFTLIGCGDSLDPKSCLKSVEEVYPDCKIYGGEDEILNFFVVCEKGEFFVKTASAGSSKITHISKIKRLK